MKGERISKQALLYGPGGAQFFAQENGPRKIAYPKKGGKARGTGENGAKIVTKWHRLHGPGRKVGGAREEGVLDQFFKREKA